jgi:hypothetical protein
MCIGTRLNEPHNTAQARPILIIVAFSSPKHAWNATDHKAIAMIAYGQLSPGTRTRVDQHLSVKMHSVWRLA